MEYNEKGYKNKIKILKANNDLKKFSMVSRLVRFLELQ